MKFTYTKKWFLIFICCVFFSCKNTNDTTIAAPLHKDKMKEVLTDLYIAEAAAELYRITKDSTLLPHKSYYFEEIFKKHNITQKQYEEAYDYFTSQPEMLLEIYDTIHSDLNALEGFEKKKPELK